MYQVTKGINLSLYPKLLFASFHLASFLVGTKHTVQYLIGMPGKTFSRLLLITAAKWQFVYIHIYIYTSIYSIYSVYICVNLHNIFQQLCNALSNYSFCITLKKHLTSYLTAFAILPCKFSNDSISITFLTFPTHTHGEKSQCEE